MGSEIKCGLGNEFCGPALVAVEANSSILRKRKSTNRKSNKKANKKLKPIAKSKKPTQRMQKLFKKRARAYNSDEEEDEDEEIEAKEQFEEEEEDSSDEEYKNHDLNDDDEYEEKADTTIIKFLEGCNAFKVAFLKIMKKPVPNDSLGPILSANKKLVAEKLLEEKNEHIAMKKKKKDKQLAGEKSHVKPDSFVNAKEKELIQIATRGVVKFFNQVNKVQYSQKGLNVSKDGKGVKRPRNQPLPVNAETPIFGSFKVSESDDKESEQKPGWAPLRDNYMLSDSKFKDWNEMPDSDAGGDDEAVHMESSSDDG